jgi:MFS family permease
MYAFDALGYVRSQLTSADFGNGYKNPKTGKPDIEAGILGFISACYQLGSILAVPVAPWFNQKYGRRWSIMFGSLVMCFGAILQGFAQHRTLISLFAALGSC